MCNNFGTARVGITSFLHALRVCELVLVVQEQYEQVPVYIASASLGDASS